jgi:hypothetical protein
MYSQWLKTEHDRLHIVEQWPDGPHKSAALTAIRSSLESLARKATSRIEFDCETCLNRHLDRQRTNGVGPILVHTSPVDACATLAA